MGIYNNNNKEEIINKFSFSVLFIYLFIFKFYFETYKKKSNKNIEAFNYVTVFI